MGKVITVSVHCIDGVTCVTDSHFFHKDFGSQLVINGLNLETGTQVHFSLTEKIGKPISMIGVSENGLFSVDVPDNVLNSNSKRDDYEIYAFVYCTDENSGWTEHEIVIPVKMRPDMEFEQPTSEELTAFDKVAQYVSETVGEIVNDREQIKKNKEDIEYLKEHGADNVKIEVDKELSTKSENPIANKAVAKEFEKYGGTVEITENIESSKEKSVMIINPNAEEVLLYTAEEIDVIVEELRKNGVSEEDIANAVKKYLDENPIEIYVPEKLSELEDDENHRTVSDKEKEAWNGKLDASKLPEAVNTALAQAKESGEFDGADGTTPHIGANGNWFIGDVDTGVSAGGNGSGEKPWRLIRDITVPEDVSKDTSDVEWFMSDYEGYENNPYGFLFDKDEDGNAFAVRELFIITEIGYERSNNYYGIGEKGTNGDFALAQKRITNTGLVKQFIYVHTLRDTGYSLFFKHDTYGYNTASTHSQRIIEREDKDITQLYVSTYKDNALLIGSTFKIYGR